MHIPRFMRRVNRVLTNPVLGMFAWVVPPLAVVHHFGRKSRRSYRTPVVAFRSAAGFVIPMTYGRDVDGRAISSARTDVSWNAWGDASHCGTRAS